MLTVPGTQSQASLDLGAAGRKLALQALEAAIEAIDAVDDGTALDRQAGDHRRHRANAARRACPDMTG